MIRHAAAVLSVTMALAGCSTSVAGRAQWPIPHSAPGALEAMLLTPEDVSAAMGADMATVQTREGFVRTRQLDDTRCQNAWAPADDYTYDVVPVWGSQVRTLQSPDPASERLVSEALVSFDTIAGADGFFAASLQAWKVCANRAVTMTPPGGQPQRWEFAAVSVDEQQGLLSLTRTADSGAVCQRVMVVRANVIGDVAACGFEISDQGVRVAQSLAAKVPVKE